MFVAAITQTIILHQVSPHIAFPYFFLILQNQWILTHLSARTVLPTHLRDRHARPRRPRRRGLQESIDIIMRRTWKGERRYRQSDVGGYDEAAGFLYVWVDRYLRAVAGTCLRRSSILPVSCLFFLCVKTDQWSVGALCRSSWRSSRCTTSSAGRPSSASLSWSSPSR